MAHHFHNPVDQPKCPNPACGAVLEDNADDYAVPNRTGDKSTSEHQCPYCDRYFKCTRHLNGKLKFETK